MKTILTCFLNWILNWIVKIILFFCSWTDRHYGQSERKLSSSLKLAAFLATKNRPFDQTDHSNISPRFQRSHSNVWLAHGTTRKKNWGIILLHHQCCGMAAVASYKHTHEIYSFDLTRNAQRPNTLVNKYMRLTRQSGQQWRRVSSSRSAHTQRVHMPQQSGGYGECVYQRERVFKIQCLQCSTRVRRSSMKTFKMLSAKRPFEALPRKTLKITNAFESS